MSGFKFRSDPVANLIADLVEKWKYYHYGGERLTNEKASKMVGQAILELPPEQRELLKQLKPEHMTDANILAGRVAPRVVMRRRGEI